MEVEQIWTDVCNWIRDAWDKLAGFLVSDWKTFTQGISQIITDVENAWKGMILWFQGDGDLQKVLKAMWSGVTGAVQVVATQIEGIFKLAWDVIAAAGKVVWDGIAMTAKTAWDAMVAVLKTAWDGFVAAIKVAWDLRPSAS